MTDDQMSQIIQKLPRLQRAVFVMAIVEGKPLDEVAGALRISRRRVDKRLARAIRKCQERRDGAEDAACS
jgi:RNA polymerase sigma factor (sigma-70 family)